VDAGAPMYCALYPQDSWDATMNAPKPGANPFYVGDAIDVPLATGTDTATISFLDVTPGNYVPFCHMDTIGGGQIAGSGDPIAADFSPITVASTPSTATRVFNFALP
jgi:hypothetical protein